MADIRDFKDLHEGEEVAILANGPSLLEHLDQISASGIETIGINASLGYYPSKYHVAMDQESLVQIPEFKYQADVLFTTNLPYRLPNVKTEIVDIRSRHTDVSWSTDLEDCIYTGKASIWFALQVAAWLGFRDIYLIGFDLNGLRPEKHLRGGTPMPGNAVSRQLELMGYLRGLVDTETIPQRFYNCSQHSSCSLIPKVKFATRHFTKTGVYEPAMDVDIVFSRKEKRLGGGVKAVLA